VYGTKPDYRVLFRLFSTAYFLKQKDVTTSRAMAQAHSMQGIAVGHSEIANGMEIWNPTTKKLHTENVFRLDEHSNTPTEFRLQYDGGLFLGILSSKSNPPEPFPINTKSNSPIRPLISSLKEL
jgi:hypothetical protein